MRTVKLREWGWLDMAKHPAENLDAAFRKWFEDRANILHRIEYVNPYLNLFGVPLLTRKTIVAPYTGFIIKLVRTYD